MTKLDNALTVTVTVLVLTALGAWATHIVWIITFLVSDLWSWGKVALALIGAFMPPVGIIHGVMIWFGAGF